MLDRRLRRLHPQPDQHAPAPTPAPPRSGRHQALHRTVAVATIALLAASTALVAAPTAQAADPPAYFTLHGSGWGHGVGMPQYGAYEMARRGSTGTAILRHYYTGTRAGTIATPARISVQVYGPDPYNFSGYGDTARTTTVTVSGGAWRLRSQDQRTLASGSGTKTFSVTTTAGGRARVTVDGTRYYGHLLRIQWSGTRYWRPGSAPAVASIRGTHGTYRHGRLTITEREGIPNITNDLLLNSEYLYGIAEMPSSWGLSGGSRALRAQAITARSYAISKLTLKSACRCHVVDDVRDQQYTGWRKENEGADGRYGKVWKSAVNATRSSDTRARVLTYRGRAVAAHYYSSSGGRTANSEDVWSSAIAYERSVSDPYSKAAPGNSMASWTRRINQSQAKRLFSVSQAVVGLSVAARYSSGQVKTLRARLADGSAKSITGKADAMRTRIGPYTRHGSMPSSWITRITAHS